MRNLRLERTDPVIAEAIDLAVSGQPSVISLGDRPKTVIVSLATWDLIRNQSFGQFLMSAPFEEGDIPERDQRPMRLPDWAE